MLFQGKQWEMPCSLVILALILCHSFHLSQYHYILQKQKIYLELNIKRLQILVQVNCTFLKYLNM